MTGSATDAERRLAFRDLIASWRKRGLITAAESEAARASVDDPGKQVALLGRIALFVLTLMAFSTAMSLVMIVFMPFMGEGDVVRRMMLIQGIVALVVAIPAAELFIRGARFRRTGIEDALYLSGPFTFLFGALAFVDDFEPWWIAVAASMIFFAAGWRLRRGLWLAAAIFALPLAVGLALESGFHFTVSMLAATFACAIAGLVSWRSPAIQSALDIVVALGGGLAFAVHFIVSDGRLLIGDVAMTAIVICIAAAAFITTRWKSLLYASLLTLAVLAAWVIIRSPGGTEWKIAAAGLGTLIVARVAATVLRDREEGITAAEIGDDLLDELEPLGALATGVATSGRGAGAGNDGPALDDASSGSDSSFGGGGATSKY